MPINGNVLVIDDEEGICSLLKTELSSRGYKVVSAPNGREALNRLAAQPFQVALCDMRMPELDGMEVLRRMHAQYPDVQVIMMTGYASIETAIEAMKKGAYDFIEKPFQMDHVASAVNRAISDQDLQAMMGVYEMSRVVFSTMDLTDLLNVMMRNVKRIIGADDVSILMRHDGQDWYSVGTGPDEVSAWETDHRTLAALVQSTLSELHEPFLASADILASVPGIATALLCPLHTEGDWQGLLVAVRREPRPAFLPIDIRHATIFAGFGTQAVRNARLYDQLIRHWKELDEAHKTLKEAQETVIQHEKMAAVGQLAAGIAHELNNPLTGIMGFSQLLAADAALSPQQHTDAQTIYTQSLRCKKIIENLLLFSRRRTAHRRTVDLRHIIESAQELVRYEKTAKPVAIKLDVPEGLFIHADFAEIQHLFLNLLTNAQQALQGVPNPQIRITGKAHNRCVIVHIRDNGPGISPEYLAKIFDPFFTTKPFGQGTGLGLCLSQTIAKAYGGHIDVESELGHGALFTVEFPAAV